MVPTTTRRFLFHASASAYGGRIVRPRAVVLVSEASSSVGISGGRAESRVKARHFKPFLQVAGAATVCEGRFDDAKRARALTLGEGREEDLTTSSSAKALVEGVVVGSRKRLVVDKVGAALRGGSVPDHDEPSVVVAPGTLVRGVVIDGCPLAVEIDFELFEKFSTYSAWVADGAPGCLDEKRPTPGSGARRVLVTVVKSLRWTKRVPDTARIEGHTVKVDDFGRIHFGEMFIDRDARRLTMMRLRLGSPEGGSMDFAEVETNGVWYPPIL